MEQQPPDLDENLNPVKPPDLNASGNSIENEPGNIDLYKQPKVKNPDGSISTVDSIGINEDGLEVVIPRVTLDGRHLSSEDAIKEYHKTGRHLGKFSSIEDADAFAQKLHEDYAAGKYEPKSIWQKAYDVLNYPSKQIEDYAKSVGKPIVGPGMMEIPGVSSATGAVEHAIDPTDSPFYSGVRPFIAGGAKLLGDTLASGFDPRTAGVRSLSEAEVAGAASKFKPRDIELPAAQPSATPQPTSAFSKPKITAEQASKNLAEGGQMLPKADINLPAEQPIVQPVTPAAVTKLNEAIKQAKPLNELQAAMNTLERGQKIAKAESVTARGEEGARQSIAAMAGKYDKALNEPLQLEQPDVDGLFDIIKDHTDISAFDKLHARTGLWKVLDGSVPQPHEVSILKQVFGPEFPAENLRPDVEKTLSQKLISETVNLPRAMLSTLDFSAPLRQGLGLIHKKEWRGAWDDMFKAGWKQEAYDAVQQGIKDNPSFGLSQNKNVGLKLTELGGPISQQEEKLIGTRLIEKVPGVRGSNRAYVAFLNKVRMDTFDSLIKSARAMGHDPDTNLYLTKQIADFVNNATGRGSLGRWEKNAEMLNNTFFSPRLIASRLQMVNPKNYLMTDPFVRKEYWKSLAAITASGNTFLGLAALAGATVSLDSTSADFGKAKIGNTRFDPWGGFQQYAVLASRLAQGKFTTSSGKFEGRSYDLGSKFGQETGESVVGNFVRQKTNPLIKFGWDWLRATKNRPFDVTDEMKHMLVPFIAQDIMDTYKDNPDLLPLVIPASAFGMGTQTY